MHGNYILKNGEIIEVDDIFEWAEWFESQNYPGAERFIARTDIYGVVVSTVFLGLDHNFSGSGDPILFETLVFGGKLDEKMERYTSLDDALEGHQRVVGEVIENITIRERIESWLRSTKNTILHLIRRSD